MNRAEFIESITQGPATDELEYSDTVATFETLARKTQKVFRFFDAVEAEVQCFTQPAQPLNGKQRYRYAFTVNGRQMTNPELTRILLS